MGLCSDGLGGEKSLHEWVDGSSVIKSISCTPEQRNEVRIDGIQVTIEESFRRIRDSTVEMVDGEWRITTPIGCTSLKRCMVTPSFRKRFHHGMIRLLW